MENKIRAIVIDTLNRLPFNDVLTPHVLDVGRLAIFVMTTDNDDNAISAIRVFFELLKSQKPPVSDSLLNPFFKFLKDVRKERNQTQFLFFFVSRNQEFILFRVLKKPKTNKDFPLVFP